MGTVPCGARRRRWSIGVRVLLALVSGFGLLLTLGVVLIGVTIAAIAAKVGGALVAGLAELAAVVSVMFIAVLAAALVVLIGLLALPTPFLALPLGSALRAAVFVIRAGAEYLGP